MKGVAAFLKDEKDGSIRLVFNDIEATSAGDSPSWKHIALFTHNDYDAKSLKELSLSKEQFAEIGENVVIRLLALGGHLK